jgi:hypothetical protein
MWLHAIVVVLYAVEFVVNAVIIACAKKNYPSNIEDWLFSFYVFGTMEAFFNFASNLLLLYLMNEFSVIMKGPARNSRNSDDIRHSSI